MNAVLHFIPDDEHPDRIVAAYAGAAAPGSYLALSHAAPDLRHPGEQAEMLDDYRRSTRVPFINREPEVVASWLDGMRIEPPGLVPVNEWYPDSNDQHALILRTYGVLARIR